MELWTEYEGKTIDGTFPLNKLVAPEGRSAFFSTANGNGDPTLIRLIESHFDADEILARWHGVQALGHPNLLRLESYNQVAIDGTDVIYAVMEPVDANLAAVLSGQRLTVQETMQLAASMLWALDVLHTHGFVHEHVEPANIFAVGDVVKLRSDCIREAPEGEEGVAAKKRDIHDLGVVLLQALTQKTTLADAAADLPLPSPFDHIVRRSMSGEWGLAEIQAALQTPKRPPVPAPVAAPVVAHPPVNRTSGPGANPISSAGSRESDTGASANAAQWDAFHDQPEEETDKVTFRTGSIIALCAVIALGLWLGWHFARSGSGKDTAAQQPSANSASTTAPAAPAIPPPAAIKPNASAASSPAPTQKSSSATTRADWRVVAYTYNHQEKAQAKSAEIAAKYPDLHPDVFSPSGQAPWLVTVGGVMSREDALALVPKARKAGLPGDTYAQNYSSKTH